MILLVLRLYFPENSIHVVVVDPGVGTARRPMAAKIGTQYYVGPDNGTITLLLEHAEKEGWKTRVSSIWINRNTGCRQCQLCFPRAGYFRPGGCAPGDGRSAH